MKVRYTPRAFSDREAIFSYLESRNPAAAQTVASLIARRIRELAERPFKGRKTDRVGIYTLWVAPYPYRIFYSIQEDDVVILHIRHTSRRPWAGED
jgi:toxin ParE1/3/4